MVYTIQNVRNVVLWPQNTAKVISARRFFSVSVSSVHSHISTSSIFLEGKYLPPLVGSNFALDYDKWKILNSVILYFKRK